MNMKTDEFNEHYEIDRKSNGVKAKPKTVERQMPAPIHTADGEIYDPGETYYFFDSSNTQVRQSTGLRRIDEHLCTFGLKVVSVAKLRANRDDALAAGQSFFKLEIARLEKRIENFEAEKTGEKRPLKNFSLVNQD